MRQRLEKSIYTGRPVAYNVMLKPIGPVCNLNCTYCYYLEKKNLYQHVSDFKMSEQVLEKLTREYIESQNVPVITFVWQGGEPTLLGLDYYKRALEIQNKYAGDKRIENVFQTNGTLLDDEWCRFFHEHNFLIGVSIDGPKELHDNFRKTRSKKGSWDKVMRGIELCKKHKVEFNTLSVVNRENAYHPLEVYHFLKEIGSGFIQFIPIVERIANQPDPHSCNLVTPSYGPDAAVAEWCVEPLQYGKFLCSIFDEWVRQDVGRVFVQIFDCTLANWVGERAGLCVFNETCGDATAMEHNGDLYTCDHFVYPEYYLGNILEKSLPTMIMSQKQIQFGRDKRDKLPRQCLQCEYRFTCHGGCPKNRISVTADSEPGLNYLCPGYKMFFSHVHPYMQYMGDELKNKRAPANVMDWIKRVEKSKKEVSQQQQWANVGRNDPCPCGSGKKYKNCCMKLFGK